MKESICQGQETIRPEIRIVEREAKLVTLWDWEIARFVGEASIASIVCRWSIYAYNNCLCGCYGGRYFFFSEVTGRPTTSLKMNSFFWNILLRFKVISFDISSFKNSLDQRTPLTGCFRRNQSIDLQIKIHPTNTPREIKYWNIWIHLVCF